jgi:uncharacterized protein (TIRG00374 family)
MRKLLVAIALLFGIVYIFAQKAEVQAIAETLSQGDFRFIFLALSIEAVWMLNIAASYWFIYRSIGLVEKIDRLILLAVGANFVNVVAPTAGVGGMAVFISDAQRRNHSPGRVTLAGVLFVLFDYLGVLTLLALGLFVLFRRNNLNTAELVATAILLILAVGMASLLVIGLRSEITLGNVLAWIAHQINRLVRPFLKRDYLSEHRPHAFAHDMAGGLDELRRKPHELFWPAVLGLSSKVLLLTILLMMFLAFKVPLNTGTLVAGFSIGYLFLIVSPTPAGIGVVEGALTLALTSLQVPLGAATVIALAYRGVTFWVPLLVGMLAFRIVSHETKVKDLA